MKEEISTYRDTMPDTFVATDALGREVPTNEETGALRSGKTVGLFYYIWCDSYTLGKGPVRDITKLKKGVYDWADFGAFHYWGEPFMGYYNTKDPYIIRKHCQMFNDAGVDVLFFDNTNALIYEDVITQIINEYTKIREEGFKTPYISSLLNSRTATTAKKVYNTFFDPAVADPDILEKADKLWFRWEGKPMLLASKSEIEEAFNTADNEKDKNDYKILLENFTFRRSWAWVDGEEDTWAWLASTPQKYGWHKDPSVIEQVSVTTAEHPTTSMGKSYAKGKQPEDWCPKEGLHFKEQWETALEIDPSFILITQWNEWIAQRFLQENPGKFANAPIAAGESFFVDVYNWEFNRDIEPMRNDGDYGWGDNYYYQMVSNIRKYKGARPIPAPSPAKTIDVDGDFSQWADVLPGFLHDFIVSTPRDYKSSGKIVEDRKEDEFYYVKDGQGYYKNNTLRNKFDTLKIAQDKDYIYFYAKTVDGISPVQPKMWMNLFLSTDKNTANWHGYNFIINRSVNPTSMTGTVEKSLGGWSWEVVCNVNLKVKANELMFKIARKDLLLQGIDDSSLCIDFKWSDNTSYTDDGMDIMDFMDKGETAPNGRFNYRYKYPR